MSLKFILYLIILSCGVFLFLSSPQFQIIGGQSNLNTIFNNPKNVSIVNKESVEKTHHINYFKSSFTQNQLRISSNGEIIEMKINKKLFPISDSNGNKVIWINKKIFLDEFSKDGKNDIFVKVKYDIGEVFF